MIKITNEKEDIITVSATLPVTTQVITQDGDPDLGERKIEIIELPAPGVMPMKNNGNRVRGGCLTREDYNAGQCDLPPNVDVQFLRCHVWGCNRNPPCSNLVHKSYEQLPREEGDKKFEK